MIGSLAKLIDWFALQFFWALRLRAVQSWNLDPATAKLQEALRFLNGPDFIPAESQAARVALDESGRFTFPTSRPCEFKELNTSPLNLTLSTPVIPTENILLIEGRNDLFVETEAIEELWNKWRRPEIWRLPHGHISWMAAPGLTARVLRWLSLRSNAGSVTGAALPVH